MPPSHRSSSSHHSSHSSHSSHRSSHSSSSHSSRSYSSSSSSYGSSYVNYRTRKNQPTGYTSDVPGYKQKTTYRCKKHDYVYYPTSWTDSSTGKYYDSGYYDENGDFYRRVIVKDPKTGISQLSCEYCGTDIKTKWEEGAVPVCPNCGANMQEIINSSVIDELSDTYNFSNSGSSRKSRNSFLLVSIIALILPMAIILGVFVNIISALNRGGNSGTSNNVDSNIELFGDSIYVEEIGREIYWKEQYESYYDSVTDCYVYYNTSVSPAVWQYWYEDISSDYGDYGWMEYEIDEDQWYIEKGNGSWIKLPSKYDTSKLWHFTGMQAGTSYLDPEQDTNLSLFGEDIYIVNEDKTLNWNSENEGYYNPDANCYVWYNTSVNPFVWQYWYDDISRDCGWMEYDSDEDQWYCEKEKGKWIVVPSEYDTSELWHIEGEVK